MSGTYCAIPLSDYLTSLFFYTEPENIVAIQTVESTVTVGAGDSYTLNCTVVSEFHPVVSWIDPDGNPVNGRGVAIDEPVYHHKTTYMLLTFHSVHTSQAGRYTCQSTVRSIRTATIDIVVTGKYQIIALVAHYNLLMLPSL